MTNATTIEPLSPTEIVTLLRDLDGMTASAGGWRHLIPADERAAWRARKDELVSRCAAAVTR